MALRRREFGGEEWEWGQVRGTKQPGWAPWRGRGYSPGVRRGRELGPRRGEWQWRGHGPGATEGYGREYRGGVPRAEHATWPENVPARGMGGGRLREEIRSGGLPRGRGRFEAEGGWTPGAGPTGPRGRPRPRYEAEGQEYGETYRHSGGATRRFRPGRRREPRRIGTESAHRTRYESSRRTRTEPAHRYDVAYGGRPGTAARRGVGRGGERPEEYGESGRTWRYGGEYPSPARRRGGAQAGRRRAGEGRSYGAARGIARPYPGRGRRA